MAEQLIERPTRASSRKVGPPAAERPNSLPSARSRDALRQAKSYLETAGKRLRGPDASQADEVLLLLRQATAHLEQAIAPDARRG
jgi:hypothetical protein